jgi:phosphoglycerate dehydrogenase-like enzyme
MKKLNILVNLPAAFHTQPELRPFYERLEKRGTVRTTSHNTADEIRGDLAWADAVIMWSWPVLTDDLLDAAPKLMFRGHMDIGQDQARIGLRRKAPISLSKGGWSPAVSEMALTLILSTLRKTSNYHAAMRRGAEKWVASLPADIDPDERQLTGRNVGIVGLGQIGRRLAELLAPFRVRLRACDPYVGEDVLKRHGAERVELDDLIRESEVVVVAAASNPGTRHLVGAAQIALFRPRAVFVNVARAALVDTDALVARLKKGDLYAAIDVFDKEPLAADHPLRALPNAYLTPHRAGGLMESCGRVVGWLVDDFEAVLDGRERRYALTEAMVPALDR